MVAKTSESLVEYGREEQEQELKRLINSLQQEIDNQLEATM
jgi:F0F1-type ATP synthase membrane subunit b/b'